MVPGALEDPGKCPLGATAPGPTEAVTTPVSGECPLGAIAPDPVAAAGCCMVAFGITGWETCVCFGGGRTTSIDEDSVEVLDGSVVGPKDGDEPSDPTAGTPKWAVPSVLALLEFSVIAVAAVYASEGNQVYG